MYFKGSDWYEILSNCVPLKQTSVCVGRPFVCRISATY